jgi:para-nitrobenzyl esterase
MDEDCLSLNVFTPPNPNKNKGWPTMVWIHGGGFMQGSGSDPQFAADILVQSEQVVVVTLNYRLSLFGNLALPALVRESEYNATGGMNSHLDQIEALRWVRSNIRSFGGDPDSVTIFGESAGAISICTLAVSPLTRGLFARFILESGDCTEVWEPKSRAAGPDLSAALLARLGIEDESVAHLRSLHGSELLAKAIAKGVWYNFLPSFDGHVLHNESNAKAAWAAGDFSLPAGGAAIIGGNSEDGLLEYPQRTKTSVDPRYPRSATEFKALYLLYFRNATVVEELAQLYNASSNASLASILIGADLCVLCPAFTKVRQLTDRGFDAWAYYFTVNSAREGFAIHGAEVPSVFGRAVPPTFLPGLGNVFAANFNQTVSDAMRRFWGAFARSGDPGEAWPRVTKDGQLLEMVFDNAFLGPATPDKQRLARCAYWSAYREAHPSEEQQILLDLVATMNPPLLR